MPPTDPPIAPPTADLTRLRRVPERGVSDRATIDAILDAGLICHLGYLYVDPASGSDAVRPVVVPTLYARDGDDLVLHGSSASRAMRAGAAGFPVCVTVTIVDGLVLARSTFHHSANYRSVVVHGDALEVTDPSAKLHALEILTDHVAPGRWQTARQPDAQELKATTVLRVPLTHASAKVRDGGAKDEPRDLDLDVWAGVVPIGSTFDTPMPDVGVPQHLTPPLWDATSGPTGTPLAPRAAAPGRR